MLVYLIVSPDVETNYKNWTNKASESAEHFFSLQTVVVPLGQHHLRKKKKKVRLINVVFSNLIEIYHFKYILFLAL